MRDVAFIVRDYFLALPASSWKKECIQVAIDLKNVRAELERRKDLQETLDINNAETLRVMRAEVAALRFLVGLFFVVTVLSFGYAVA